MCNVEIIKLFGLTRLEVFAYISLRTSRHTGRVNATPYSVEILNTRTDFLPKNPIKHRFNGWDDVFNWIL